MAARPSFQLSDEDEARLANAKRDEAMYQDAPPEGPVPEDEEISLNDPMKVESDPTGGSITTMPNGEQEFSFNEDESQSALASPDEDEDLVFGANLAQFMTQSERYSLADYVIESKDADLASRSDWKRLKDQALELLGIKEWPTDKLPFPGAAAVTHPILAEAVVQFQSNAIEEFFPATGPVKGSLAGDATDENEAQVMRAETFLNYYLTEMDKGYYADCDQELFVLPIDGSTFKKVFVDPVDGMPKSRYVNSDDFIAPYFCVDLETSPRYTHRFQMTGEEITRAIRRGTFMDVPLPQMDNGGNEARSTQEESDRRTRILHEDDKLYWVLEQHNQRELPENVDRLVEYDEDGNASFMPSYVVTVIEETRQVLSVKRLWDEEDPERAKDVWFSHKKFLPGLGFYGWGFPHVIGSLAMAATGAERVLLDSALMASMQGGFRAKDGAKGGESMRVEPGVFKDVDATMEDLQKTFFNPPFKEPAPALFQIFQALVQDGRRFASITEVLVGTADNKAPVGTTLALIEQSMKLFTAIHKRIFAAARQEFGHLAKLMHRHAPFDAYPYYLKGKQQLMLKSDFDARVDFIPVADPNIISGVQRISIAQAVLELANSRPDLYGPDQMCVIHEEFLKALKVPYADKVKPKAPKPTYVDAVTENAMMMTGVGVKAFPGQAHQAHAMLHQQMVMSAQTSLPADQFEPVYMNAMAHIREHLALDMIEQISAQMQQQAGVPMPPIDISGNDEDMDPQLEKAITMLAARMMPPQLPKLPQPGGDGGEAQADPVADAQANAEAKAVETQAGIERDTTDFVAEQHRDQERHQQEMRHNEEKFQQAQDILDRQAAADIIRKNAASIQQRRDSAAQTAQKLAHSGREAQMQHGFNKAAGESKLELQKKAAAAKPKPGAKK